MNILGDFRKQVGLTTADGDNNFEAIAFSKHDFGVQTAGDDFAVALNGDTFTRKKDQTK